MSDIVERLRKKAFRGPTMTAEHTKSVEWEAADEIERLRAENDRLRAALANSKEACVYCSLPAEEWAKCKSGFPGCSRSDDAMGCPELGASLEASGLRARVAELEAIANYDTKADVLYITFRREPAVTKKLVDGVLARYNYKNELVGLTILDVHRTLENKT